MSQTPRLRLPYILQSQSQKEVTHNEALNVLDAWVQPLIEDRDLAEPPLTPVEGQVFIVAAGGAGDWAGQGGRTAQFIGGAWWFHAPEEGFTGWLRDEGLPVRWTGAAWEAGRIAASSVDIGGVQVLGPRQGGIADAAGGVNADAEARDAINALLAACRAHGLIAP